MGRAKKARKPSSQYDSKRSASKKQSPPRIGELEISPVISPAVEEKSQPAVDHEVPESQASPRGTQTSEHFDGGLDESDLYDIELNWDEDLGTKPEVQQKKVIAWSEADSATRRSSPARETEASGPDIWQFGDNHSVGVFSSPKTTSDELNETVRLSQSQPIEVVTTSKVKLKGDRQIDFSETATTNHRSSSFGLSEGPGHQPWEFDASSAATMPGSHGNSELPDTLPIPEATENPATIDQVTIEPSKDGDTSSVLSSARSEDTKPAHSTRDSGVNLTGTQSSLAGTEGEEDDDLSQDHDFHQDSDDDFVPSPRSKNAVKQGNPQRKPLSERSTMQKSMKQTHRDQDQKPIHKLRNAEVGPETTATPPSDEKSGSKSKRPKQRPKAPLRFDSSTQQLKSPAQDKSKAKSKMSPDHIPPPEATGGGPSLPPNTRRSTRKNAPKASGKVAPDATNKVKSPDEITTERALKGIPVQVRSTSGREAAKTTADSEPSSKPHDAQPRPTTLINNDDVYIGDDEGPGSALVKSGPSPQTRAVAHKSLKPVFPNSGVATKQSPKTAGIEPGRPAQIEKPPKKRKRSQIREIASTFDICLESGEEGPTISNHTPAKKPKTMEGKVAVPLSHLLTPITGGPPESSKEHHDAGKVGAPRKAAPVTAANAEPQEHRGTARTADDHSPGSESMPMTRAALSPRNVNALPHPQPREEIFTESSGTKLVRSGPPVYVGNWAPEKKRASGRQKRQLSVSDLGSPMIQNVLDPASAPFYIPKSSSDSSTTHAEHGVASVSGALPVSEQPAGPVNWPAGKQKASRGLNEARKDDSRTRGTQGQLAKPVFGKDDGKNDSKDLRHKLLETFYRQARESGRPYDKDTARQELSGSSSPEKAAGHPGRLDGAGHILIQFRQLSKVLALHLESLEGPVRNIPLVYAQKSERCLSRIQRHFVQERDTLVKRSEQDARIFNDALLRDMDHVDLHKQKLDDAAEQVQEQVADRSRLLDNIIDRLAGVGTH